MKKMQIYKEEMLVAASLAGIPQEHSEKLWNVLASQPTTKSTFDLLHVLYYLGAAIVVSAMGWLLGSRWEQLGAAGILALSLLYAAIFLATGAYAWKKESLRT